MYDKLVQYHDNYEEIYCAALNDAGNWIVISDKHYSASTTELLNWLRDGELKYGELQYVAITNDARIAVFEHGYLANGNYPKDLWEALDKPGFHPKVIKMAGSSWFFADATGKKYRYTM
ncbi:MAG: hypothetical protein J6U17_02455 [Kiritimatiellae bacterium]|nr:hypothetical protein [Kiritimatiellia bacterium]